MPPAKVDLQNTNKGTSSTNAGRSLDPLQENTDQYAGASKHRPASLMMNGSSQRIQKDLLSAPNMVENIVKDESIFTSPRRAPKPPSYPSPVSYTHLDV